MFDNDRSQNSASSIGKKKCLLAHSIKLVEDVIKETSKVRGNIGNLVRKKNMNTFPFSCI